MRILADKSWQVHRFRYRSDELVDLGHVHVRYVCKRLPRYVGSPGIRLWLTRRVGLLSTVLTWSLVSAGAAIVGACLPTLRPLTRLKAIEGLLRSTKKSMRSFASKDTLHPRDDSLPAVDISARDETSMEETRARRMTEASLYQEQKQQPAPAG